MGRFVMTGGLALALGFASGCGSPADNPESALGSVAASVGAAPECELGGRRCEGRQRCVDIDDDCDPIEGDAVCPGACQSCDDPSLERTYAETSRMSCARIRLRCDSAQRPFNDTCGCGCERAPGAAD